MLSRVAENLYWMARYLERAEDTARLINARTHLELDLPRDRVLVWEGLILALGLDRSYGKDMEADDERAVVQYLVGGEDEPSSLVGALSMARENARTTREVLPRAAWERINVITRWAKDHAGDALVKRRRAGYLQEVIGGAQRLTGLLAGSMLQDHPYRFMRLGRNLERADMTSRILELGAASATDDLAGGADHDSARWLSVLDSLNASQMYRRVTQQPVRREAVLRFLLKERRFPRTVLHCLAEIDACLRQLKRAETPRKRVADLERQVRARRTQGLDAERLPPFLDRVQSGLIRIDAAIAETYFQRR